MQRGGLPRPDIDEADRQGGRRRGFGGGGKAEHRRRPRQRPCENGIVIGQRCERRLQAALQPPLPGHG